MAATRASTGNARPRVIVKVEEPAVVRKTTTKKKTGATKAPPATSKTSTAAKPKTKANISKPREKKVGSGRVTKADSSTKKAPSTTAKKVAATTKKAATTAKKEVSKATSTRTSDVKVGEKTATGATKKKEPTLMDKISGVALTVEGMVTGNAGKKAAGTAKMRGTAGSKVAATATKK